MRNPVGLNVVVAAFLLAIIGSSASVAATIVAGDEACSIRLDGPVRQGDKAQLSEVLEKSPTGAKVVFCLNSPGGSYSEALAIIDTLLATKRIVATMVPKGSHCYSACALVFLSGHSGDLKDQPDRRLDASSILGFHGPYIKPGEKEYDPVLVARAYREGMKAIGKLIGMSREHLFPESLLSIGMEKGPEEFFYIDTIDKAGKWDIALVGMRPQRLTNRKSIFRACSNSMAWMGGPAPFDDIRPTTIQFTNRKHRAVLPGFGDEAAWTCVVDVYDAGDKGHLMDIHWAADMNDPSLPDPNELEKNIQAAGNAIVAPGKPAWYSLEKTTKLRQLASDRK